jgi:hypothetical protein
MPQPCPIDGSRCIVSFTNDHGNRKRCHRWSRKWGPHASLICGTHWRRLTKAERATWRRMEKRVERYGGWEEGNLPPDFLARHQRLWHALARRAGS